MVIYALGEIGNKKAVIPLIANYGDENDELREMIIYSLGEIGGSESLEFISFTLDEENPQIRLRAVEGLGTIANPNSVKTLITTLYDASWKLTNSHNSIGEMEITIHSTTY
jgi:hypothetical protein